MKSGSKKEKKSQKKYRTPKQNKQTKSKQANSKQANSKQAQNQKTQASEKPQQIEVEFLSGLKDIVKNELKQKFKGIKPISETDSSLSFTYSGNISKLKTLKTVVAVYAIKNFDIPRPKALLGNEQWRDLMTFLKDIKQLDNFESFRLSAAGKDSSVFQRIEQDLAQDLRLKHDEEGDFLLRFRSSPVKSVKGGWQVLARISRRPLSARAWRQCNLAGGLNATVATAMLASTAIKSQDRIYCPMCGSGTLAIEAALAYNLDTPILASDISESALACAQENIKTLKSKTDIKLYQEDVTQTSLEKSSVDVVLVNMPWGDAISSIEENAELYPAFFKEMERIVSPNGRILLLTHDIRRFEHFMSSSQWQSKEILQVYHGGHYPKLYLINR